VDEGPTFEEATAVERGAPAGNARVFGW